MDTDFWKSSPFGEESIFHPSWEEKTYTATPVVSNIGEYAVKNDITSKYKIVLLGGADYYNDGTYGSNLQLAQYINKIAISERYNIPLQRGDITIVNSPIWGKDFDGNSIYQELLSIIKKNFNPKAGALILYGYSWGAHLLMSFLRYFQKDNIAINLLITIDAAKGPVSFSIHNQVTQNVKYNLNIYQKTPSLIGSHGWPNDGKQVKNVNLTNVRTKNGEEVRHSNIDEYTLFYCAQVIAYALKNNYGFANKSESQIKKDISLYAAQGF